MNTQRENGTPLETATAGHRKMTSGGAGCNASSGTQGPIHANLNEDDFSERIREVTPQCKSVLNKIERQKKAPLTSEDVSAIKSAFSQLCGDIRAILASKGLRSNNVDTIISSIISSMDHSETGVFRHYSAAKGPLKAVKESDYKSLAKWYNDTRCMTRSEEEEIEGKEREAKEVHVAKRAELLLRIDDEKAACQSAIVALDNLLKSHSIRIEEFLRDLSIAEKRALRADETFDCISFIENLLPTSTTSTTTSVVADEEDDWESLANEIDQNDGKREIAEVITTAVETYKRSVLVYTSFLNEVDEFNDCEIKRMDSEHRRTIATQRAAWNDDKDSGINTYVPDVTGDATGKKYFCQIAKPKITRTCIDMRITGVLRVSDIIALSVQTD